MTLEPDLPPETPPTWTGAVLGALLTTLERPVGWPIALLGFFARGGILLFLLPIITLPTPAGIQADLAPLLVPSVLGGLAPGLVVLVAALIGGLVLALVVGGLVGAWSEVVLIRLGADPDEDAPLQTSAVMATVVSAFALRIIAHAPLLAALAWSAGRIAEVGYRELVTPFEVTTPLAIRLLTALPDALVAIGVTWLFGEAAGGRAVRELVLGGRSFVAALLQGWIGLLRRPSSWLTLLATTALVAIAVLPGLIAAGAAWQQVKLVLFSTARPADLVLGLALFVALWLGAVVLAAGATAWRSLAWTATWRLERGSRPVPSTPPAGTSVRTIGTAETARPGGWPSSGGSGTL